MISPNEFVEKWKAIWEEEPIKFSVDTLEDVELDEEAKKFLIEAGLPDSAAPSLSFHAGLTSICEEFGVEEDYSSYKYFGSTGWGDPICLYEDDGSIVYLDHEENLEYETLINSSIPQLAESLLAYAQLIEETKKENGDDAFLDNNIPERLKNWIFEELKRIDPVALEDGFWKAELESLDEVD